MKRENTYLLLLAVAVLLLWDAKCSGNGTEITLKTKEVKGSFRIDTITVHDTIKLPKIEYRNGKPIYKTVIDSIDYAIISKATKLVDSFKVANDSLKEKMFISRSTPMNFKKTFEDTAVKINIFGKHSGELYGIGMDYTIKPQTVKAQLKQYLLLGGVNMRYNGQFNKSGIDAQLDYISPNKTRYSIGKDLICKDCFTVGIGKKIFEINRAK
mgnify:CR=1 FL=1